MVAVPVGAHAASLALAMRSPHSFVQVESSGMNNRAVNVAPRKSDCGSQQRGHTRILLLSTTTATRLHGPGQPGNTVMDPAALPLRPSTASDAGMRMHACMRFATPVQPHAPELDIQLGDKMHSRALSAISWAHGQAASTRVWHSGDPQGCVGHGHDHGPQPVRPTDKAILSMKAQFGHHLSAEPLTWYEPEGHLASLPSSTSGSQDHSISSSWGRKIGIDWNGKDGKDEAAYDDSSGSDCEVHASITSRGAANLLFPFTGLRSPPHSLPGTDPARKDETGDQFKVAKETFVLAVNSPSMSVCPCGAFSVFCHILSRSCDAGGLLLLRRATMRTAMQTRSRRLIILNSAEVLRTVDRDRTLSAGQQAERRPG
jgi:hypothetical protein